MTTRLPKWKGWSSKIMQISREGTWIHLQQKLKTIAFTEFFNCLLKNDNLQMRQPYAYMLQINE